jgi:hypothetical protein
MATSGWWLHEWPEKKAASSIKSFRLLDLPYEVRRMVCIYIIRSQDSRKPRLTVAAKVNKQLYEEILPVHCKESLFSLEYYRWSWISRYEEWKGLSKKDMQLVKHLRIMIP